VLKSCAYAPHHPLKCDLSLQNVSFEIWHEQAGSVSWVLKAKEVQSIPVSYFELERNLGMFSNLLGTVLGTNHALTLAYRIATLLRIVSFWFSMPHAKL
jgi:hypothetical protein